MPIPIERRVAMAMTLLETPEGQRELAFIIARSYGRQKFFKLVIDRLSIGDKQELLKYIEEFVTGGTIDPKALTNSVTEDLEEKDDILDFIRHHIPDPSDEQGTVDFWSTLFDHDPERAQACLEALKKVIEEEKPLPRIVLLVPEAHLIHSAP